MDCKMVSKTPEIARRAGRPTGSTKKKYLTPQRMQDVEDTLTLLTGKAYEDSPTVPKGWDVEKWAESACYRATQVVWSILNEKDSDSLTAAQIIFRLAKKLESKNASRQAVEDTINALAAIKHVIVDAKIDQSQNS
jgi:hypothetical protein